MKYVAKFLGDSVGDITVPSSGSSGSPVIDRIRISSDNATPLRVNVLDGDENDGFDHILQPAAGLLDYAGPLPLANSTVGDMVIRRPNALANGCFCFVEVDYHRE